jgi:hypothetical protein
MASTSSSTLAPRTVGGSGSPGYLAGPISQIFGSSPCFTV